MKDDITYNFEKIYANESDGIFRFCLVRVSDREQALDITQETFLRLWQSLNKKDPILNNKAFLFTIARRLIIDWYRKKKSLSLDNMLWGDESSEKDLIDEKTTENLEAKPEGRYLLDKINELDYNHREPIYLRFVEDLSPQEIGKILGISANAASVRINRALLELRKITGYNNDTDE
jgi:RNA polymerase sigma-70 factor (ECF subfamily)